MEIPKYMLADYYVEKTPFYMKAGKEKLYNNLYKVMETTYLEIKKLNENNFQDIVEQRENKNFGIDKTFLIDKIFNVNKKIQLLNNFINTLPAQEKEQLKYANFYYKLIAFILSNNKNLNYKNYKDIFNRLKMNNIIKIFINETDKNINIKLNQNTSDKVIEYIFKSLIDWPVKINSVETLIFERDWYFENDKTVFRFNEVDNQNDNHSAKFNIASFEYNRENIIIDISEYQRDE